MSIVYTNKHRTVPAIYTQAGKPFHPGLVRWLGEDANLQRQYTSRQAVHQWWPAGATTTAGELRERYMGTWLMLVPQPFTRLIVELGGYAVASGGTTWRLYSTREIPRAIVPNRTPAATTIVSTTHVFTSPQFAPIESFAMDGDNKRATWLRLTAQNLTPAASGRLWTMHVRPSPDATD